MGRSSPEKNERKHTCLYGQKCFCGANERTQVLGQRVRVAGVGGKAGYPRYSDAMGVHPKQRAAARQESIDVGVPTDYDSKGCAVIRDAAHDRAIQKALGFHDRGHLAKKTKYRFDNDQ